ncbi:transcription cofactor vestigial-like protein 1 isoform X2 [Scleropages formosus]|uniref:transcription cofactor vestigial-like protein 1 isoform X2 n=1 Tax=Scleropages formosus TaxID=113540 RepID=UPI0008782960|nr:transcription cofactor vestigial-like protein 1 isoform X2 [Scleropages formosus]
MNGNETAVLGVLLESSSMEDKPGSPMAVKAEEQTESVLFTYFQGDINSVVDEHFSRALNKARKPKDLSVKAKSIPRTPKPDPSPVQWAFPASSWSDPTFPSTSSGHVPFTPLEDPCSVPRVITNPGGQPSNLWPLPPRTGASLGLAPVMYPQALCGEGPGPSEHHYTNSFLNMLHSDRAVSGSAPSSASKPDVAAGWSAPTGFRDPLGSGMSLDSGLQVPEKKKDLYWY